MSVRHSSNSAGGRQARSTAPTSPVTEKTTTEKTRRSSAYDNNFEQHLDDHHIYIRNRKSKPAGLEGLYQRLRQQRPSLSPSRFPDAAFEGFQQKNEDVIDEGDVMRDVVPIICGDANIPSKQNLLFTRLDPIVNDITVAAKPDFYDGARLSDLDKRVREDIGNFIIPTGHAAAPVAPNFFLEVKRPSGGTDVAKRQACYDGALGARGMDRLQSYREKEPVHDGKAYTITSTYHDGALVMYTTHLTQAADGATAYHMTQIGGWLLTGNPDTCRQGLTNFRNGRDWAQEQRDTLISAANKRARSANAEPAFESADDNDGSDFAEIRDASQRTQTEERLDNSQYHASQLVSQEEHMNSEPQTSSCGNSDTTATKAYTAEESETSVDEIALDAYAKPTASHKRRKMTSENTGFKTSRGSDGKRRSRCSRS
ncbi:MAG: hypothetical protein M1836_002046 [Candelina mexicana]|nr:MAG: hypothetical protein M1836_002046 [Candelina mexicana]